MIVKRGAFVAKVIAVYNKKGGCGKTTTATTLAYLLARRGKRTALIDLDSQGGFLPGLRGAKPGQTPNYHPVSCEAGHHWGAASESIQLYVLLPRRRPSALQ